MCNDSPLFRAGKPVLAWVAAVMLLSGCADKAGGPIPYNVQTFGMPDAPAVVPLESDYKIAPLDTITIKVFKLEDLSGDYNVDLTGHISMPLIGEVEAADLTTAQLDGKLTERLGEKYLEHPDVSVGLKTSTRRSVTVDGAVNKAGTYPITGVLTLIQAVALAGGTNTDANAHRVAVFRQISGKRQAAAFDLVKVRHGEAQDPAIYPGDIVVIDGSSIKETEKRILNTIPILSIFRPF